MHVEICDVSCVLVKTVKTQKQIKFKKKKKTNVITEGNGSEGHQQEEFMRTQNE